MQCVHECAWEDASSCRGPVRADRMPMAFVNVRLRAQRGPRCICSKWSCGSREMQQANEMLEADKLPFVRVHASLNQALWRLDATWAVKGWEGGG